jgi:hypothetical protein
LRSNGCSAERSRRTRSSFGALAELIGAIDQIGELVKKYASLLQATVLAELEPVIQYDWKAPFRQPWIT